MESQTEIRSRLQRLTPVQLRILEARIRERQGGREESGASIGGETTARNGNPISFGETAIGQHEASAKDPLIPRSPAQPATVPGRLCLHELFERQVRRTPEAIALVHQDRRLTYQELEARANTLAAELSARGIGLESRVGILLERSPDLVVAILGILKAGAAYVPIDPTFPAERISFLLRDAQPAIVVTSSALADRSDRNVPTLIVASICASEAPVGSKRTATRVTPENLAYVIYTSGSTGSPKGVMVSHGNVVNVLEWVIAQLPLTEHDVVLSLATFCFDISVAEMFLPLSVGARVVIVDRETAMDGRKLARLTETSGATFIQPTPATYRLLWEAGWRPGPPLKMASTGERLPADLARRLAGRGATLWNLYGPTETTIWSTGTRIDDPEDTVTIGRPIANTQTYILDERLRPVSGERPGELFLGGHGVARGYLGRTDLTAERFVPDPFSARPGARMYRTGDLARALPDGRIEYLGRLDHQVKIRGYRIELGEIEAVLARHSKVRAAVVLAREEPGGEPRLAAFVIPASKGGVSPVELREFLKQRLPEYMLPTEVAVLEHLPLTVNGKIDRQALLNGTGQVTEPPANEDPTASETQRKMMEIWRELMNVPIVRSEDSFFDLGGHSLLAMRLLARIERVLGVAPALRALFECPTLAAFCDHCDELRRLGPAVPAPVDDRVEGRI